MSAMPETDPLAINQQALIAVLDRLRRRLTQVGAGEHPQEAAEVTLPPTLARLCKAFGLSSFERDIVLLAAGRELSAEFAATLAQVNGGCPYPTFSIALAVLEHPHWSALSPGGPLRAWQLVECVGDGGLTQRELHLDEQILHWLAGVAAPDPRLAGFTRLVRDDVNLLAPSHVELAHRIVNAVRENGDRPLPIIELVGNDPEANVAIAAAVAASLHQPLMRIVAESAALTPQERGDLAVRLVRASVLMNQALYVALEDKNAEALLDLLEDAPGPVFVAWPDGIQARRVRGWRFVVEQPPEHEQRVLVEETLVRAGRSPSVEHLAMQLSFAPRMVERLARSLRSTPSNTADALIEACRRETRAQLEPLAQRIEPKASWDDLIVPVETRRLLAAIASHVRHRAQVYDAWGFAAKSARGLGITVLFEGASGTGKTMAAEVLAHHLGLDLYRIDLSGVVSKYIGETEKNLAKLFDAAEGSGAILFFDEADALFGKRSEVRDSHDRYANIEVSYLLQRMESYRGLAILASNLKSALDPAFVRRLRFIVHFPFPDSASRAQIWRTIFPGDTPTLGLEPERLAQLNISGGHIRNIALSAAFCAAERGEPVSMQHVLEGTRLEYAKLEKPLADAEMRGWGGGRR
jgi:ATPase family protein associated with various cellular activities (AAA)/winged helix domain-containing protein